MPRKIKPIKAPTIAEVLDFMKPITKKQRLQEQRSYRKKYPEKVRKYQKEYIKRNPEKRRAIAKTHYWKHREKRLALQKKYQQSEKGKKTQAEYRQKNRARINFLDRLSYQKRKLKPKPKINPYAPTKKDPLLGMRRRFQSRGYPIIRTHAKFEVFENHVAIRPIASFNSKEAAQRYIATLPRKKPKQQRTVQSRLSKQNLKRPVKTSKREQFSDPVSEFFRIKNKKMKW